MNMSDDGCFFVCLVLYNVLFFYVCMYVCMFCSVAWMPMLDRVVSDSAPFESNMNVNVSMTNVTDKEVSVAESRYRCSKIDSESSHQIQSSVDATMRFKYIRQLHALFQSLPQAVLQLMYLMRRQHLFDTFNTNGNNDLDIEFRILIVGSIFVSIISMTSAVIQSDRSYIVQSKFAMVKQQLNINDSIKHILLRVCEIVHRIGVLALFWAVVGDIPFIILVSYEILIPLAFMCCGVCTGVFQWQTWTLYLNEVPSFAISFDLLSFSNLFNFKFGNIYIINNKYYLVYNIDNNDMFPIDF